MIKDKNKGYTREFKNDDPTSFLSHPEQQKSMLLDTINDAKPKPKKKIMEPIEIPEILSVPRPRDMSTRSFGRLGHYTKLPESYNKGPETPVGLSKRYTQERIHEGKILKQLDKDMANDERNRKNNKTTIGGDNDR